MESGALLILFLIVYSGLHILTWAGIRYRLPVDPVLVIFAAYGFGKIITWAMERFRKQPGSQ
jgi:hypothetical protein